MLYTRSLLWCAHAQEYGNAHDPKCVWTFWSCQGVIAYVWPLSLEWWAVVNQSINRSTDNQERYTRQPHDLFTRLQILSECTHSDAGEAYLYKRSSTSCLSMWLPVHCFVNCICAVTSIAIRDHRHVEDNCSVWSLRDNRTGIHQDYLRERYSAISKFCDPTPHFKFMYQFVFIPIYILPECSLTEFTIELLLLHWCSWYKGRGSIQIRRISKEGSR